MLTSYVKRCPRGESGITSIEYALMGSLIAVVCVAIVTATGLNTLAMYTWICNQVQGAIGGPGC